LAVLGYCESQNKFRKFRDLARSTLITGKSEQ
jgi:hypothetical protein